MCWLSLRKEMKSARRKHDVGDIFMLITMSKFPLSLLSIIRNKFTYLGHQGTTEGTRRGSLQNNLGNY